MVGFNVPVVCVVLALAVTFPRFVRSITLLMLLYLPTAIIIGIACYASSKSTRTLMVVGVGAFLGWLLSPRVMVGPTFWDLFMADFQTVGVSTAAAALVFAVLEWIIVAASRRLTKPVGR